MLKNNEIRENAKNANVKLWEIAERFGINDGNFSRKLRTEMSVEEKSKAKRIIAQIAEERGERQ